MKDSQLEKIQVYVIGVAAASVCAHISCTIEEITKELNAKHPTGTSSDWTFAKDKNLKGRESNPCRCDRYPISRRHYLFHC